MLSFKKKKKKRCPLVRYWFPANCPSPTQESRAKPQSRKQSPRPRTPTSSRGEKALASHRYQCADCLGTLTDSFCFLHKMPSSGVPSDSPSQGLGASPGPPASGPLGKAGSAILLGALRSPLAPAGLVPTPFHKGTGRLQQPLTPHLL